MLKQTFNINAILIEPTAPVSTAIKCIDLCGGEIALVVDANHRLIGTVTDGDVRRGLLRGVALADQTSQIMNRSPHFGRVGEAQAELRARMSPDGIKQLPILDADGCVVDLFLLLAILAKEQHNNWAVLMAGGLGTRLMPLTQDVPKPMICVGGKPILETIIESFLSQGFRRFVVSVNYRAEQIKGYFGDGSKLEAEIVYVDEPMRLGTAGALSLLPQRPTEPFFVMNCDIITSVNFVAMLRFHQETNAEATMGINHFHYKVPYGIVELRGEHIISLREKPEYDFFVNSGIYVLSPEALDRIPARQFFDMPTLFRIVFESGSKAVAFPLHETWLDVGQPHDLKVAEEEYQNAVSARARQKAYFDQ